MIFGFGRGRKTLNVGTSNGDVRVPITNMSQQYTMPGMISRSAYDNGFAPISAITDEILKRNLRLGDANNPDTDVTMAYAFWNAMARPNDRMGYLQFIDLLVAGFLSLSEFSLLVWHTTSGEPEPGRPEGGFDFDNIAGFTVLSNDCKGYTSQGDEEWQVNFGANGGNKKFHREDVLTLKYSVLPDDGVTGVSPGSASSQEAAIRDRLNQQQRALFDNGATPSLIVTIHARTHDEATTIQQAYENKNRGASKSGGVVYQTVIDNAMMAGMGEPKIVITPVGTANNQLAIKEIIEFTESTITSNYGVSPIIYGDATTTTFQNQELADRKFMDRVQAILVRMFSSFENELARITEQIVLPFTFVWDDVQFDLTQELEIKARTKTEQVRAFVGLQQVGVTAKQAQVMLELPEEWGMVEIEPSTTSPDLVPQAPSLNLFETGCTCPEHNGIGDRISEQEQTAQKKILNLFKQLAKEIFDRNVTNATTREIDKQIIEELTRVMQEGSNKAGVALANDIDAGDVSRLIADFGGLSEQSILRLEKRAGKVVSNYVGFVTDKINSLPADDPAKKVFEKFYVEHGRSRAKLIAQQETKNAYQNGELDLGNNVERWLQKNKPQSSIVKIWQTTSDEPCRFCKKMNGAEAGIRSSFIPGGLIESDDVTLFLDANYSDGTIPDAHANCVLGDTVLQTPDLENVQRAYYSGPIVKIVTAFGRELSVTPNHIVLTPRGWVAAKNLTNADSVISYNVGEESTSEVNPNDNKSPASIEKIFAAFVESGGMMSVSMPSTAEDFKGDGLGVQGKIDIISADSLLGSDIDASLLKCFENLSFADTVIPAGDSFSSHSSLSSMLFALTIASDGIMGFSRLSSMLSRGELTREKFISLFDSSDYDLRVKKALADDISGDLVTLGDALLGFASYISVDNIVNVEMGNYDGHVYDLSTVSTTYIANSIISSNCQCVFKFKLVSK